MRDFIQGETLCFDKPYRWTSFDVVAKVRWLLCRKLGVKKLKVGHAGTLDPLATGVVIVCTGRSTKHIDELQARVKEYVATLQLGATTPSYDLEKPIDQTYPTEHITRERIDEVLPRFMGRIEQVPPAFSACKVDGDRAYKLARKGEEVKLKAKVLVIDELEVLKGTYIRALARDIGEALESGAHLTALRRTRVGDVRVEQCMQVEDFPTWLEAQELEGQMQEVVPE